MIYDESLQLLKLMYLNGLNGEKKGMYSEGCPSICIQVLSFLNLSYLRHFSSVVGNSINRLLSVFLLSFNFILSWEKKSLNQNKQNSFQLKKENRYFYMQQEEECPFSFCKNKSCAAHSSRCVGGQLKFSKAELLIVRKCFYLGENWF